MCVACVYNLLCIMHKLCTRRVPAARTPTTHHTVRRMHTRTPLPPQKREARQTRVRLRSFANGDYGVVQSNCAATPRRSCLRQQLESSRTASRPTHPLLARAASATAPRRSRRQRVAPREEKHARLRRTTGTQHRRRAAMKLRQPRGAWCTPSASASGQLDGTRCVVSVAFQTPWTERGPKSL